MACTLTDVSKWEDSCPLQSLSLFQTHYICYSRLSCCFLQWQVATIVECLLWLHHWHIGHTCSQWDLDSATVVLHHLFSFWFSWTGFQASVKKEKLDSLEASGLHHCFLQKTYFSWLHKFTTSSAHWGSLYFSNPVQLKPHPLPYDESLDGRIPIPTSLIQNMTATVAWKIALFKDD